MSTKAIMFGTSKKPYVKVDAVFKKLESIAKTRVKDKKNDIGFETKLQSQLSGLETYMLLVSTGHCEWDDTKDLLFHFIIAHYGGRIVSLAQPDATPDPSTKE